MSGGPKRCGRCDSLGVVVDSDPAGGGRVCLVCGHRVWESLANPRRAEDVRRLSEWERVDPRTEREKREDYAAIVALEEARREEGAKRSKRRREAAAAKRAAEARRLEQAAAEETASRATEETRLHRNRLARERYHSATPEAKAARLAKAREKYWTDGEYRERKLAAQRQRRGGGGPRPVYDETPEERRLRRNAEMREKYRTDPDYRERAKARSVWRYRNVPGVKERVEENRQRRILLKKLVQWQEESREFLKRLSAEKRRSTRGNAESGRGTAA